MKTYPIMLDVRGRLCVVVGAGPVGSRKARDPHARLGANAGSFDRHSRQFAPDFHDNAAHSRVVE